MAFRVILFPGELPNMPGSPTSQAFRRLGGGYTKIMFPNTESEWILVSGNIKFGAFLVFGNTKRSGDGNLG
jgi:hypothetical protein